MATRAIKKGDVRPFSVQTISMERIFVDKLFVAEVYVRKSAEKSRVFETAKHIYDLAVMGKLSQIAKKLQSALF